MVFARTKPGRLSTFYRIGCKPMGWLSKRGKGTGVSPNQAPPSTLRTGAPPLSHPLLDNLPDAERGTVFAAGRQRKFGIGDLIEETDTECLCLVLEGQVAQVVTSDGVDTVEVTNAGGHLWIRPGGPNKTGVAILAQSPITVLLLDPAKLTTLPEAHRLAFYQALDKQSRHQAHTLLMRHADAASAARRGRHVIAKLVDRHQRMTADSEMVTKVIHSIPRLPVYATQLVSLLADDEAAASNVVELAKHDPSLAAEVMKTINSSYYALPNKVSDLQHAVVLLGFDQLHQLVIANGVAASMPNTPEFSALLLKANAVSAIGLEIAKAGGFNKPVLLSTIGLLHGLGTSMQLLLKGQFKNLAPFIDMLDPATMGARLLRAWSLPEIICETVALQDHPHYLPPEDLPDHARREVAALYLSLLCYEVLNGTHPEQLPTAYLGAYQRLAGIPESGLAEMIGKTILPALMSKRQKLPEDMRRFLGKGDTRLAGIA